KRVICDHIRAVTFLISDGVIPSNESRGYVLRRLIRRAIRHGKLIGIDKPFLSGLGESVIKTMGATYSDLKENKDYILKIIRSEEDGFNKTLSQGIQILNKIISDLNKKNENIIPAEEVFNLYDTYGFPVELTKEIADEEGLKIDENGFLNHMSKRKAVSKEGWEEKHFVTGKEVLKNILGKVEETEFIGYGEHKAQVRILKILKGVEIIKKAKKGEKVEIILDKTSFYPEMGGQIGDTGKIFAKKGEVIIKDTQNLTGGIIVHRGEVIRGEIEENMEATAKVDRKRRRSICSNHTATHLLHWALRLVAGSHIKQAGSMVGSEKFRFDFTHFQSLTEEELKKIENIINLKIFDNHPVRAYETSIEYAKEIGAIAIFGEKYGDYVRVLEIGNFSKELCGGTHVGNTSEIGILKIISETSIGSNLRRIEAVTSNSALSHINKEEDILQKLSKKLKEKQINLPKKIETILNELKEKDRTIERLKFNMIKGIAKGFAKEADTVNKSKLIARIVKDSNIEDLKIISDYLKKELKSGAFVLGAVSDDKPFLLVSATSDLIDDGFNSKEIISEISGIIDGGGGGKPELAQAGGRNGQKLQEAVESGFQLIKKAIRSRQKR
ncbi:MAG: alanine--tRNA ligase, partial [Actinomycetia bacterium]|nr:alanine--tRNA ligase [Actinomycetes bacterium]